MKITKETREYAATLVRDHSGSSSMVDLIAQLIQRGDDLEQENSKLSAENRKLRRAAAERELLSLILDCCAIGTPREVETKHELRRTVDAALAFHPMYGESWPGWPDERKEAQS